MVNPEVSPLKKLTDQATFSGLPAKSVKRRPVSIKKGAPGGCITCNLKQAEINSPQSQKEVVGSRVRV